jgi:hypothetical protein
MRPEAAPNPARWDHLQNALPEKGLIREVKLHAALPFQELPSFFAKLTRQPGLAARGSSHSVRSAMPDRPIRSALQHGTGKQMKPWVCQEVLGIR